MSGRVTTVRPGLSFFIVGRDDGGRREWLTGAVDVEVSRRDGDPWRLATFKIESLASTISDVDLFSEVAIPAGVAAVFPAFGVGKNEGFCLAILIHGSPQVLLPAIGVGALKPPTRRATVGVLAILMAAGARSRREVESPSEVQDKISRRKLAGIRPSTRAARRRHDLAHA